MSKKKKRSNQRDQIQQQQQAAGSFVSVRFSILISICMYVCMYGNPVPSFSFSPSSFLYIFLPSISPRLSSSFLLHLPSFLFLLPLPSSYIFLPSFLPLPPSSSTYMYLSIWSRFDFDFNFNFLISFGGVSFLNGINLTKRYVRERRELLEAGEQTSGEGERAVSFFLSLSLSLSLSLPSPLISFSYM